MEEGRNRKRETEGRKRKRGEGRGKKGEEERQGERKERWKKNEGGEGGRRRESREGKKKKRLEQQCYHMHQPLSYIISYRIISYQITARRLFSLLPANSCLGLYYAQHYSLGMLRKLAWLVFVSYLMPHIYIMFPMFI